MYSSLKYKCIGSVVLIPCEIIDPNPYNYRTDMDSSDIDGLAVSIKNNGILQPLLVKKVNSRYQIISGERRLRAAIVAGVFSVPCIIMNISDLQIAVFSVTDTIQHKYLNFFDESELLYNIIKEYNISLEQLSQLTGKSVNFLTDKLCIHNLCDNIKQLILNNSLTEEYAKALSKIDDECMQINALKYVINNNISINDLDCYVKSHLSPATLSSKVKIIKINDIKIFINTLNHAVDTMQKSGIDAVTEQHDSNDYLEYVVRIPKKTTSPVNFSEYIGSA